jgi:hypothetical protein
MTDLLNRAARRLRPTKAAGEAKPRSVTPQAVTVAALAPAGLLRPSGW